MLLKNYRNVAIMVFLLFSEVVFLSGKIQALLEQRVLEGGGIEVKFMQKKKIKSTRKAVPYLKAFAFQCCLQFHMFIFNIFIINE